MSEALSARAGQLLRLVHTRPGLSRSEAARLLGSSSGATSDLVSALVAADWIAEGEPTSTGRGRPTRALEPHPDGPRVLGAEITHEAWRVSAVALGGAVLQTVTGTHDRADPVAVLTAVRTAAGGLTRGRVLGMGLAVPGLVREERRLDAPMLGWRDRDLDAARPDDVAVLLAGNDATLAALGEARRGAGVGARAHLHLHLDAGVGGAVVADGVPAVGAHGLAGEYGHLPFGDPALHCRCGASGCWGMTTGGEALARHLGEPDPVDPVGYADRVLDRAAGGDVAAADALSLVARALGRGIAGLVHALDPDRITVGGTGVRLLALAGPDVEKACAAGLMSFRPLPAPAVLPAALGADAAIVGAAELVWSRVLGVER